MKPFKILVLLMLVYAKPVVADISVNNGWVRLLPPTVKTTAAYMTITSSQDDRLVSASSPKVERVELHLSSMSNGVMSMNQVENIALKQGQTFELKPGSYHIMLIGLKQSLSEGEKIPLTLSFENQGEVQVELPIQR